MTGITGVELDQRRRNVHLGPVPGVPQMQGLRAAAGLPMPAPRSGIHRPLMNKEVSVDIVYDCEFFEDGRTIDLISIGMVAGDGRELYLINSDPG